LKVDITAVNLDYQVELLKLYPQIAETNFRMAMNEAVMTLSAKILPRVPTLTGAAAAAFQEQVTGKGINMTGRVGWWTTALHSNLFYLPIVENGAKPHAEDSFVPYMGVYMGQHPGFSGKKFMEPGYDALPGLEVGFAMASERTVNALAVHGG